MSEIQRYSVNNVTDTYDIYEDGDICLWVDVKKRIAELEEKNAALFDVCNELKKDVEHRENRIAELEAEKARLNETIERLKAEAREAMKNWRRSGA